MIESTIGLEATTALSVETVLWVRHWNEHLFSFAVTRPPSLRFRSGEFVMIGLPSGGRPLLRAYSIASPAYSDELEFLSIKVADGPLTSRLQRIEPGDSIYLGRKPTGTLVTDALLPGKRLLLLSTGTGLAPFLSIIRDPDVYDVFADIVLVHSTRRVDDLAYHDILQTGLAEDPLVADLAAGRLRYCPTVTREAFHSRLRITTMIAHDVLPGPESIMLQLDPASDRLMLCGSMAMIKDTAALLEGRGFVEGSNSNPGSFVIERAFVA